MRHFKLENVEEFILFLSEYENSHGTKENCLSDFISMMTLHNEWRQRDKKLFADKVNLMTFHSAKGLEFPVCFLVGVEDHIIPHEKSLKVTGIEEERRLLYVAITRAMNYLCISMAKERGRKGKIQSSQPSRFLFDIPKELLNLTKWDQI